MFIKQHMTMSIDGLLADNRSELSLMTSSGVRLERLARDNRSTLLRKSVNYGRKNFKRIGGTLGYVS
jgi:hypothetical protein